MTSSSNDVCYLATPPIMLLRVLAERCKLTFLNQKKPKTKQTKKTHTRVNDANVAEFNMKHGI